jgi:glycosyltransferase involved in cell wall biosynthesis
MKPRRALVASYDVPRDDRDSGARRLAHLVEFLQEGGWTIDFVAANGLGDPRHVRILQARGVAVHDDSTGTVGAPLLKLLARAGAFDLALLAFWPVAELYLPALRLVCPNARIIVDSLDLHFLRDARRLLQGLPGAATPARLDADFADQMMGELNTYAAADAVLTVSSKEAGLLQEIGPGTLYPAVVPDCEDMESSPFSLPERKGILLLGSYQHLPNVDALDYLCREILPRVDRQLLADHPVYVVGTGVSESVRRVVEQSEHVRLVGWAPDVVPYFHRARITVIPLRYGAGTKRKMIQALMTGAPTVSTGVGAEGLDLTNGEHVLIADHADEFARSIERLLRDDALWQRLASNGRARIARSHSRATVKAQFLQLIQAVLARPGKAAPLDESSRERFNRRVGYQFHQRIAVAARKMVAGLAPTDGIVLVASGGNRELLQFGERTAWHFPRTPDGRHRADGFADGLAAVNHLESLRSQGAEALLVPSISFWMLERYPELKQRLEGHYRLAGCDEGFCRVYDLRNGAPRTPTPVARVPNPPAEPAFHPAPGPARLIAFYLPQFHPIPENDCWWGEGFTEWRNVARARPLFPGHQQPQLPADLGYYDLRLEETRWEQAQLARRFGIHGFCYYHYWFHGKRLLERPFNDVLTTGRPDFPFCLCWANEPWSRRWDGSEADILQPQSYSAEDDLMHIRWLLGPLADARAITIDGRALFLIYQGRHLPDAERTLEFWRREAERAGLKGLYLAAMETGWDAGWDATQAGFDAKVLFQPQFSLLSTVPRLDVPNPRLRVYDYQQAWPILANPAPVPYLRYETVFPSWDNTPRRGEDSWVVHNSTPEAYEQWLRLALQRTHDRPADQRIVFINAWNEWAEGCHLEPDQRHGLAYLEATRAALGAAPMILTG